MACNENLNHPKGIEKKKQLLVEGNDQRNFFKAFIQRLALQDVQIQNFGGVNQLRNFLPTLIKTSDFKSVTTVGIVRDAEKCASDAFKSVQSSLTKANLSVPPEVGKPSNGSPTVYVFILPGDDKPGMLETLLCQTFADQDVNHCIDGFFKCADALPDMSIKNREKARAFAYLATRPEPRHSVGVAAKQGYWDLDHEAFDGVRTFLREL